MAKIRVLIIDDHPATAEGVCDLLQSRADLVPVGVAAGGAKGLHLAETLHPDVVLLDLELPDQPGAAVARQLRKLEPSPQMLAYSAYDDPGHVHAALAAGMAGRRPRSSPSPRRCAQWREASRGTAPRCRARSAPGWKATPVCRRNSPR